MSRHGLNAGCVLGCVCALLPASSCGAEPAAEKSRTPDPALVKRAWVITDVVLENHLEPCSRQEMILAGVRALFKNADASPPRDLSRRVSELATQEQVTAFLQEVWPASGEGAKAPREQLEGAFLDGMLQAVPGGSHLLPAHAARAMEQAAANRYVGTGIQIRVNQEEEMPQIVTPFPRGPAHRAGARPNDLIVKVDDKETKGARLAQVVEWLRGDDGTDVTMVVRQPGAKETRTLKITRTAVPIDSALGYRRDREGEWTFRLDDTSAVGYVWVKGITSATLNDLRGVERRLQAEGVRALVIDLRGAGDEMGIQSAGLVADGLLDGGLLWRLHDNRGEVQEFRADRECLFRGWPLAVLVNAETSGPAAAVAAALHDNGRAVVVGEPPRGEGWVTSLVHLPDGQGAVSLRTGRIERGGKEKTWPLKPDHAVAMTRAQRDALAEWQHQKDLSELPEGVEDKPPEDPPLAKAVELLQAALKAAGEKEKR
jgi:C-terminal peptidase prc